MNLDISYDTEFSKCTDLRYYPWVGEDYKKQNFKILVLGESHYYGEYISEEEKNRIDNNKNHTRQCYEEQLLPYQCMNALLANNLLDNEWVSDKICFYNYIQKCVGYTSNDRSVFKNSKSELIEVSRKAFFEVLKVLSPDLVIVWGISENGMWNWMPGFDKFPGEQKGDIYWYKELQNTKILHIHHPSRNFNMIEAALKLNDTFSILSKEHNKNCKYPLTN